SVSAAARSASTQPAAPVRAVPVINARSPQRATETLVADYDREIAKLHLLIEQRRNQIDPVTVAVIEKNLQVIDSAIAECKRAIARDRAGRSLIEPLTHSLEAKGELMRTAALLPSRS